MTDKYSKLRLVFVHAENDGTMPWNQTEELCRSTLRAATESGADDDAWSAPTPKYEAVDLGEAGKQEVWETHTARIEKLIAKHGGKHFPARYKEDQEVGVLMARFGSSRSPVRIVDFPGDHTDVLDYKETSPKAQRGPLTA